MIALYASIAADFVGMIPAIIKTYHFPKKEITTLYMLDVIASLFNLLAVKEFTPQQYSYPVYIMIINLVMVTLIVKQISKD